MNNSVKPQTRNFALHVPGEMKEVLRVLAEASDMTLTQYVESVITEAIRNKDVFETKTVRRKPQN